MDEGRVIDAVLGPVCVRGTRAAEAVGNWNAQCRKEGTKGGLLEPESKEKLNERKRLGRRGGEGKSRQVTMVSKAGDLGIHNHN